LSEKDARTRGYRDTDHAVDGITDVKSHLSLEGLTRQIGAKKKKKSKKNCHQSGLYLGRRVVDHRFGGNSQGDLKIPDQVAEKEQKRKRDPPRNVRSPKNLRWKSVNGDSAGRFKGVGTGPRKI